MSCAPVTCTAEGCAVTVERGKLMCKGHWFSLPKPLRDEIWASWRAMNEGGRNHGRSPTQQLERIRHYRDAVRGAVAYLRGVPPTPAAAMATTAYDSDGSPIRYTDGRLL